MSSVKKISAKTLSLLVALLMLMGMFTVLPGTVSANAATVSRPASISAKALNQTQIKISWSKVNGASGYRIYRSTSKNGGYKRIKTITNASTTSYINKSLVSGKTYYYKIKAYKGGSSSRSTASASATTIVAKNLYNRYINNYGISADRYCLYDVDSDGTSELITTTGTGYCKVNVYTIKNGKVSKCVNDQVLYLAAGATGSAMKEPTNFGESYILVNKSKKAVVGYYWSVSHSSPDRQYWSEDIHYTYYRMNGTFVNSTKLSYSKKVSLKYYFGYVA